MYKTTDGGANWTPLPVHDFSAEQWVIDNIPVPTADTPYFSDMDDTVDPRKCTNGHPVRASEPKLCTHAASWMFYSTSHSQFVMLGWATSDGISWEIDKLSDVYGHRITSGPASADAGTGHRATVRSGQPHR